MVGLLFGMDVCVDAGDAALQSTLSLTSLGSDNQQTVAFIETDADSSFNILN